MIVAKKAIILRLGGKSEATTTIDWAVAVDSKQRGRVLVLGRISEKAVGKRRDTNNVGVADNNAEDAWDKN